MRAKLRRILTSGLLLVAVGCGGGSSPTSPTTPSTMPTPTPTPAPSRRLASISLSGRTLFSAPNQQAQMVVTARFSDETSQIVTDRAVGWSSSNRAIATVSLSGLLTTGQFDGITEIGASYEGIGNSVLVTVTRIPNSQQNLTGTFSGTVTFSNRSTGPMTLVLEQIGNRITGFGQVSVQFEGGYSLVSAVRVEGTVNGPNLTINLLDNQGSCPKEYRNTVTAFTNSMMRGTFEKRGGCDDFITSGTYSIAKE
ncbi:MAG: Ig-like domain-containing protein [Vicinamibacterales bacterium]